MNSQQNELYLTGLLNETLPPDWVDSHLEGLLGLPENSSYLILHAHLDNILKRTIDQLPPETVTAWKKQLQTVFESLTDGTPLETVTVLNLLPYTRTLVMTAPDALSADQIRSLLDDAFQKFNSALQAKYGASVAAFVSAPCAKPADLSPAYKKLRQLSQYRFVNGMGLLTHADDRQASETVDLIDYKYLQYFQEYLAKHDCRQASDTIDELVASLRKHHASDSRAIYIFKELIGSTIRHLYAQQQDYELIARLNDSITYFDRTFDDITQVQVWLKEVVSMCLDDSSAAAEASHPYMKRIIRIIEADYAGDLSLQELASRLHVTDSYLSRLFKEELEVNFKDYLTAFRMNKAKELLESTELTVREIGEKVGYPIPIAFTRAFKNHEGISPRDYRNLH